MTLKQRIKLSPEEVKRFLGVTFDADDDIVQDLIDAAKEAAEGHIGDFFGADQTNRIEDFESFADDAALNAAIAKVGTPTLKLSNDSFEEAQSMEIDYDVSSEVQGFIVTLSNALDFREALEFIIWVKGLKENSEEAISIKALDTSDKIIIEVNTLPRRFTRFEDWTKIKLDIEGVDTVEGLEAIKKIEFNISPQEGGTGKLLVDFLGFTVADPLPVAIKVGALRYIARKYQDRPSGVVKESEGGISFEWGDPVPDEWKDFKRITVE